MKLLLIFVIMGCNIVQVENTNSTPTNEQIVTPVNDTLKTPSDTVTIWDTLFKSDTVVILDTIIDTIVRYRYIKQ